MTLRLYFDTETSDYHEETSPSLPVEVSFTLGTEDRVLSTISCILMQTGWEGIGENPIADRVIRVHGITPQMARMHGTGPDIVLNIFRRMIAQAEEVVAHNIEFDIGVMNHAVATQRLPPIVWPKKVCTMRLSAPIVRIPSGGRYAIDGWKAPKLLEAYRHFSGRDLVDAHNGLTDVFACRLVHRGCLAYMAKPVSLSGGGVMAGSGVSLDGRKGV